MNIRLGYACICLSINKSASHTLTYTRYKKLENKDEVLDKIILNNFKELEEILKFNYKNDIYFYRMTSNLIPLITHPLINLDLKKYKDNFKRIGNIINKYNMRVDFHMDPYYVLNSTNKNVVTTTINVCKIYQNMLELMNIKSHLIFHIGAKTLGKKEMINSFINNFILLDSDVKKIIMIENDDKIYNIKDTLYVAKKLNIPMCLDYHHYKCNNEGEDIFDYLKDIFDTFEGNPKIHFSSPKSKKEYRAHHDYIDYLDFINFIEKIQFIKKDIDIMLESKMKDEALFRLVRQLKYKGYKISKNKIILKNPNKKGTI